MQDTVIVGAVESGERAEVQKALKRLIRQVNENTFDIAELLYKAKEKHLYTEPTFIEFAVKMGIKKRKAEYLERLARVMALSNVPREEYEPLGIAKLRIITRLNPLNKEGAVNMYTNPSTQESFPMADYVVGLVEQAKEGATTDTLEKGVRVLLGEVGENDMVWRNFRLPRLVDENTIAPALEKAAINIGTVRTDDEGMAVEVQDWRKLEVVCVEYVNDKNSDPEVL
jgi:ribosomal protein S21